MASAWRERALTLEAAAAIFKARVFLTFLPPSKWHGTLGLAGKPDEERLEGAKFLAGRVERANMRLPFNSKCLPQAMALSWMMRKRDLPHDLVIASRPAGVRTGKEDLHAWVEQDSEIIHGELPGPWSVILRLPAKQTGDDG